MEQAAGHRFGWLLHRPLFIESPEEGESGYWSVRPTARSQLVALLRRHPVGLVASGHLHKAHEFLRDDARYVRGPSSAFLGGASILPPMPGEKRLGAVCYARNPSTLRARIAKVPGLTEHWIDDVIEEICPAHLDTRPDAGA